MGRDEDRDGAAEDRAEEADDLGEGPGAEADDTGDDDEDDHDEVEQVHDRKYGRAGSAAAEPAPGPLGRVAGRGSRRVAQVTVIVTGGMSLSGDLDRVVARLELAEVDDRRLRLGDLDADRVRVAGALDHGDRDVVAVLVDVDRVEDVARLDAARPGRLDEDVAAVDRRLELLDARPGAG